MPSIDSFTYILLERTWLSIPATPAAATQHARTLVATFPPVAPVPHAEHGFQLSPRARVLVGRCDRDYLPVCARLGDQWTEPAYAAADVCVCVPEQKTN